MEALNKFAANFALNNLLGRRIYMLPARKSFDTREETANLRTAREKDWIELLSDKFEHPATVLWRAIELGQISRALDKYCLKEPILDLGCAEGKIAEVLFKDKKLIGLDNCWQLLSQNNKTEVYEALILADGCQLPFKTAAFAAVFSNCVIEHIPDLDSILKEVHRVLRDKGVFLFTVPSHKFADFLFFSYFFDKLKLKSAAQLYKVKRNKLLNHFHCYDHNRWKDMLQMKGFSLIEYKYYMPKKITFIWDFLTTIGFVLRINLPLKQLFFKLNKLLSNYLKTYCNVDVEMGSGLLIIASKSSGL